MDWNVFFSTVSQTSGAIIGIFSAFIITKIVNNETEYKKNYLQLHRYIADSLKLANEAKQINFDWYNQCKLEDLEDELKQIEYQNKNIEKLALEYYKKCKLEDLEDELKQIEYQNKNIEKLALEYYKTLDIPMCENREYVINEIKEKMQKEPKAKNNIADSLFTRGDEIRERKLSNNEEKIDNLYLRINYQQALVMQFVGWLKQQTESSSLINISIIVTLILFYIGVIYPLSFLPVETDFINLSFIAFFNILFSFKGGMLFTISSIFTGLMIFFLFKNNSLVYKQEDINELDCFSNISNYSTYLNTLEDNLKFLKEQ